MLHAVPRGWFSYNFIVFDRSGTPVARTDLSSWRETAKPEVGGTRYEAEAQYLEESLRIRARRQPIRTKEGVDLGERFRPLARWRRLGRFRPE